MRIERFIYSVLIIGASLLAIINWRKAAVLEFDNEELRDQVRAFQTELQMANQQVDMSRSGSEKLREQTAELMRLRNEVTQLRNQDKQVESLRAQNEQLKEALTQRSGQTLAPSERRESSTDLGSDVFPRERWTFAGYASPESALVSAIWAMKEGNPETYLNSLAPQEQERMAKIWQEKSESEIADKHRNDVSSIAGLRVLERQNISPTEVIMNVLLEGPGRMEKIRMNQVGQEWKFGGFIREQQAAAP